MLGAQFAFKLVCVGEVELAKGLAAYVACPVMVEADAGVVVAAFDFEEFAIFFAAYTADEPALAFDVLV